MKTEKKLKQMPIIKLLSICLLGVLLPLCSCNDEGDDVHSENIKLIISEKIAYELGWTDKTEDFYFTGNRLSKVVTTQITTTTWFEPYIDKDTVRTEDIIDYAEKQINITQDNGNELVYTLNEQNKAVECVLYGFGSGGTRHYTFTYTPKGMLAGIEEDNGSLHSECNIDYTDNDIVKTTTQQYGMDFSKSYTASNVENTWNFLCPVIIEAYPLYFHRIAFHMGILGKLSEHLIEKVVPEGATNEYITYSYTHNTKGYITSCVEKTVSYGSTHTREIKYSYY